MPYPQIVDPSRPIDWSHPLNRGLLARWRAFPEHRGSVCRDLRRGHRYPINGTLSTSAKWAGAKGRPGGHGSLELSSSGTTSVGTFNFLSSFHLYSTWTAWIRHDGTAASRVIFGSTASGRRWQLNSSHQLQGVASGVSIYLTGSAAVPSNTWTHVAMTENWNGTTVDTLFYINGKLDATGYNNFASSNTAFSIGMAPSSSNYFTGNIDDVCIFDHALTAAEILAIYYDSRGQNETLNWLPEWYLYPPQAGGGATAYPWLYYQQMMAG